MSASVSDPNVYWGTLGGTTSTTFDPATGIASILDLELDRSGVCPVTFTIQSNPADYVLTTEIEVDVKTITQRDLVIEETSTIEVSVSSALG